MSMGGFSEELIEHARKEQEVPADWEYAMCANECGEIVFVPPGVVGVVPTMCSMKCALEQLMKKGS